MLCGDLDGKEIQVRGDICIGLTGKGHDAGKDWGQEEEGVTEDEMVGWRHRLKGHESEQTLGDSEGQGSLVCCSPRGHRVRHDLATEQQQYIHIADLFYWIAETNTTSWSNYTPIKKKAYGRRGLSLASVSEL